MITNTTKSDVPTSAMQRRPEDEYGYQSRSKDLLSKNLEPYAAQIFVGKVIEINQQLNFYLVRVGSYPDIKATSLDVIGRSLVNRTATSSLFGVGASVYVMLCGSSGSTLGVILGAAPEHFGTVTIYGSQELIPASPVGSGLDKISNECLNSEQNNYNGGRPVDAYPGDTTILSSFGAGLFIGALQASLRASGECAVECHYIDSLVRLTSFNFEQFSAGADLQLVADCGDYTEIRRVNSYVIESVGGQEQYGNFPKQAGISRSVATKPDPKVGKYAVEVEDQMGWWRWLDLSGYLANVKLQFVLVPKLDKTRQGAANNIEQDEHAVFREHVDSTGAYSIVSAKSISLIKDCLIPAPREQYRPDDSRGDRQVDIEQARTNNKPNLKDADIDGIGANVSHASVLYAAASTDMASFKTHRSLVKFRERIKDWSLKEIDEIDLAGFKSTIDSQGFMNPSTNVSEARMFAQLPKVGTLKINANEEARYFASRSMIMMHDDGSVHIQDGYGSAISMRGGCIDISCPGDITLRPGRNLVGFAGDSISAVAGVDVELCGMKGDIRIQADRNVSVLGGNDGNGGILLETKAAFSPVTSKDNNTFKAPDTNANPYRGIWFKAPNAAVCTLANQAYIGNNGKACDIAMNCGVADFTLNGDTSYILTENTYLITNPDTPRNGSFLALQKGTGLQFNTPGSVFFRSSSFLAMGASDSGDLPFYVQGNMYVLKSAILGSLQVPQSGGGGRPVPPIDSNIFENSVRTPISNNLTTFDQKLTEALNTQKQIYTKTINSIVNTENSSLKNLTFYYPDSLLRGIPDSAEYVLFEADWQSAYRTKGPGQTLKIRGVKVDGAGSEGISADQSYCWPGLQALQNKFGKLKSGVRFVEDTLAFKKSGFDQPLQLLDAPGSFQDNYTIIRSNSLRTKQ